MDPANELGPGCFFSTVGGNYSRRSRRLWNWRRHGERVAAVVTYDFNGKAMILMETYDFNGNL